MVSFEMFVKAMPPSLSESKVLPSFCFAFKIPDDRAASINYAEIAEKSLYAYKKVIQTKKKLIALASGPNY